MLNHLKKHWHLWIVALLCIAIALFVVWFSDSFQACIIKYYYESSDHEPERGVAQIIGALKWNKVCAGNFLKEDGEAITAFFTLVLSISTILLWLSTQGLWNLTKKSVGIAERTLTDLERPYVFILDWNWRLIEEIKSEKREPAWVYVIANGGKLPAIIRRVSMGIKFGSSIPSMGDQPPVHELLTAPLIDGSERRKITQRMGDEITGTLHECEIRGGKALIPAPALAADRVIAKISIEYDGPITSGHITTACWEWHPVKYAFTQYGGAEHNQRT